MTLQDGVTRYQPIPNVPGGRRQYAPILVKEKGHDPLASILGVAPPGSHPDSPERPIPADFIGDVRQSDPRNGLAGYEQRQSFRQATNAWIFQPDVGSAWHAVKRDAPHRAGVH